MKKKSIGSIKQTSFADRIFYYTYSYIIALGVQYINFLL